MDEKKLVITVENEGQEIIIREGEALAPKYPIPVKIVGNIESVARFLAKRIETLDQRKCNIAISRKEMLINMVINESDPYNCGLVQAQLMLDDDYKDFGINTAKKYSLVSMADFLKMHRYCFEDSAVAMQIVAELKNFKAKVNKQIEKADDNKGNTRALLEQTVQSNIPKSFTLSMPVFKNEKPRKFQVEINIIVRDSEMECMLESLEANDLIKTLSGQLIDGQLMAISGIAPDIVQIEL